MILAGITHVGRDPGMHHMIPGPWPRQSATPMSLDRERAEQAIHDHIARRLNISTIEAARGIYTIVNETMARAARTHIIERNRDPRDLALVAFGGAGPAHAVVGTRILGMSR